MNEEMLRGLTSRRSNRAFAPEQITDEELHKVLAAGMNAPTAKNGQSPIIIAVQNPDESPQSTRSTRSSPRTPTPTTARPPFCSCSCRAPSRSAIWTARQCSRTCATAHTPPGSRPAGSTGRSSCLKRTRAAKCSVAGAWRATGAASAPWRSATPPPPTRRPGPARKITAIS